MNSTEGLFSEPETENPEFFGQTKDTYSSRIANPDLLGQTEDSYATMMHASQLAGMLVPGLGLVAPIGLWIYGKEKSETVKRHGLHIINWTISLYILFALVFSLCFLFIGFIFMPFLLLSSLIFPIIGAVKASNGKEWKYPLSYQFFQVEEWK